MSAPRLKELRDDAVTPARGGGASISKITKDPGISGSCLRSRMHAADVADGTCPGVSAPGPSSL